MKIQAIVSSLALVAVLSFSGAALAQNMIGGEAIPTDRVQEFNDACQALRAESTASLTTDDTDMATGSTGADTQQAESPDPAAQSNWDTKLAGLTLAQCDEAFPAAM